MLTSDVHRHRAGEVHAEHENTDSAIVAAELVTTSITSGGDGDDDTAADGLEENPNLKFYENRRGCVRTKFGENQVRADHRVPQHVTEEGATAETAASFVVEDGSPALNPA